MKIEKGACILEDELKITKGCRFNAADRLRKRDRRRTYITAAASVVVIMLSMLPFIVSMGSSAGLFVSFLTIMMSIIILTYSLLQYSAQDPVIADQHHRCGLELNALRRKLRVHRPRDENLVRDISARYDEILQKYPVNHERVDFEAYKFDHLSEFNISGDSGRIEKRDIREDVSLEFLVSRGVSAILVIMASILSISSINYFIKMIKVLFGI